MSMWLDLVKIDPALLAEIRTRPELIDDLFFGYGPAHFLTPDEVARVAEGLRAEHWSPAARAAHWNPAAEERDATEIVQFFLKAAEEGKSVLGGVS